jgi:hypothetical protein
MTISSSSSFNVSKKSPKVSNIISPKMRISIMHSSLFLRCKPLMTRFVSISLFKLTSPKSNATTSIRFRASAKQSDANQDLDQLLKTAKRRSGARALKYAIRKTSKGQQIS